MERERNGKRTNDAEKDGIRKAALFLSILDEKAAEALLARFEPEIARAIEAEARRVGVVAPEDVDAIVVEFLALSEPEETSRKPARPEKAGNKEKTEKSERAAETARSAAWEKSVIPEKWGKRERSSGQDEPARPNERNAFFDVQTNVGDELQPLDAIAPERLAQALSGAARTTIAIALARLSERRRAAVVALLPAEKAEGARRALSALVRTTDAARRLEGALFNGALGDE